MIAATQDSLATILELFFDGFAAMVAVALVAPVLGVLLVLRRMPMLGLAVPQLASCGQAATYFFFALVAVANPNDPEEPGAVLQFAGSMLAVVVGMLGLVGFGRDRRFLGVQACIVFLAAMALSELLYMGSPYHKVFEEALHHGRLLTVNAAERIRVWCACVAALVLCLLSWRRLWLSAFDPDQARLLRLSPNRALVITLLLLGGFCALCVPVVGAEVVLTLLLVPAAVLRGVTPSLAAYPFLAVLAGLLGSVGAFYLACLEGVDWPPGPAVVLMVILSSLLVAGVLKLRRR